MDFPKHNHTIRMGQSIMVFKEVTDQNFKIMMYYVPKNCFNLSNNADPDKMPPYVAFHLSLHYLPTYLFTGIDNERVNIQG